MLNVEREVDGGLSCRSKVQTSTIEDWACIYLASGASLRLPLPHILNVCLVAEESSGAAKSDGVSWERLRKDGDQRPTVNVVFTQ